ncbi:chromosome segregation protein SMC [Propionicicella superfundia]|uniref:chromosome segregation protein SMC n=1 Tax=Propionicicella superfundia TaxID=348582 RepID=UPI000417DD91|nr:chromosome segregation protein SMC [Propionicicella superfundia]
MYLKSLTLRGFKSFASTTTLAFEPGITCVVGPNGSGKSNVVDALSWVMGEQGAKSLRGGRMEDVIFAGTSSRAPLGRAEVVLTIDNSDGALPIEYSEVTISRTMFRNGGSEYAINGHTSRLLDVQELLSDSGIGRRMHVIVGQGQLDAILQATPEIRRGFIEEAAGILKHRVRKEKALRKLDATAANVVRLTDLLTELRRQLKPLGRQAEVARKAAVIQADLRDAQARLLADDLTQARAALAAERERGASEVAARKAVEDELARVRAAEDEAEAAVRAHAPAAQRAQETWYALAGLRERFQATASIAADRARMAEREATADRPGRDPAALDLEAENVSGMEVALRADVDRIRERVTQAERERGSAEASHAAAEQSLAAHQRAIADRREGLARLTGEVEVLASRAEAAAGEIGRLSATEEEAASRAEEASVGYRGLESTIAGLTAGETGLDAEYEAAEEAAAGWADRVSELQDAEQRALRDKAALTARLEGLRTALEQRDAGASLLEAGIPGVGRPVAELLTVEPGYETALAVALAGASQALTVDGLSAVDTVFARLRADDLGRASVLPVGAPGPERDDWPRLPGGARYAVDLVTAPGEIAGAIAGLLARVAVVADVGAARELVTALPEITAVTRDGDLVTVRYAAGGSASRPSAIELHAQIGAAETELASAQETLERTRFALTEAGSRREQAAERVAAALARLHESDARMEAVAEQLGRLRQEVAAARAQAERLAASRADAEQSRARFEAALVESRRRLELAESADVDAEPDPAERDRLAVVAREARAAEMAAGLELRTAEERLRSVAGRAESLRAAAASERASRERHAARKRELLAEAAAARAVHDAARWAVTHAESLLARAESARAAADDARAAADAALADLRGTSRRLAADFEQMVATQYQGELAVAQHAQRIDALTERALTELGLDVADLLAEFGPDQQVPSADAAGEEVTVPYRRAEQEARLAAAGKQLALLGRINPLALEEFEALQERHGFLSEQLEDVKRTQADLLGIIAEVDARVEQVFKTAYGDVAEAFERAISRLFPGGEGRLVLTDPDDWLGTGVDVEARPAGKKLKRLSLLSGGERSLVAVAFLVALFTARPSPFYILDEVEAALDDTNLGRLLEIYEELRADSQLIVITHQKRTMEIADALYGVTMRSDGVSTVISERLRDG